MGTLLLTRPLDDSKTVAEALAAQGIATLVSPLTRIEPLAHTLPEQVFDGLLLTSRHAVAAAQGRAEPCFVVGPRTAEYAQERGLTVSVVQPTAAELLPYLHPQARYLYLAAEHISEDFTSSGAHILRVITYRAAEMPLSAQARHALAGGHVTAVAFYSARSAALFGQQMQQASCYPRLTAYCLSDAVAVAARKTGAWGAIRVAARPDGEAMLQLLSQAK